ncbi:MAG: hypothetical protein JNK64_19295 [Myxococcales bacterium]|nr:hypothetical protein [Myxococcales bacterium]
MRVPPWLSPAAAAIALALGVLVLDWVVIDIDLGLSAHVGPRSIELCSPGGCVDGRHAGKPFAALPTAVFLLGLVTALGLIGVAVARVTHTELGPIATAVTWASVATAVAAVLAILYLAPDSFGQLGAGFPLTLVGAVVGIGAGVTPTLGAFEGGRSRAPIRSTAVVAAPAAAPPARPAATPYDLAAGAPAAPPPGKPLSKTARPNPVGPAAVDATRDALRFVVQDGAITADGLAVRVARGGERTIAWRDLVEVVARRMPPDPPYEKTTFVDLVVADGPPLRLVPTSRLDYAALPGGQAPNTKENWRNLVALARQHNPAIAIEADSADFFAGGRDAPMFPALKKFVEWDRRYG